MQSFPRRRIGTGVTGLEEKSRKRELNRKLLRRSWDIEGVTGTAGAAGLVREGRLFAGPLGHHVACFAQNPLNGLAGTMGALHFHGVVRLHDDLFKNITALKTSKLKNGHFVSSV